jgi:hypothetical protein
MLKRRKVRSAGHVARAGKGIHIGYLYEFQKERDHYEDQDVNG